MCVRLCIYNGEMPSFFGLFIFFLVREIQKASVEQIVVLNDNVSLPLNGIVE